MNLYLSTSLSVYCIPFLSEGSGTTLCLLVGGTELVSILEGVAGGTLGGREGGTESGGFSPPRDDFTLDTAGKKT